MVALADISRGTIARVIAEIREGYVGARVWREAFFPCRDAVFRDIPRICIRPQIPHTTHGRSTRASECAPGHGAYRFRISNTARRARWNTAERFCGVYGRARVGALGVELYHSRIGWDVCIHAGTCVAAGLLFYLGIVSAGGERDAGHE